MALASPWLVLFCADQSEAPGGLCESSVSLMNSRGGGLANSQSSLLKLAQQIKNLLLESDLLLLSYKQNNTFLRKGTVL